MTQIRYYPMVSVVIPAYNHADFIVEAMLSVSEQTYSNIELIVVDDGSTDNTYKIACDAAKALAIPCVVRSHGNGGISYTLNRAIEMAQGEYVAVLASDDRFLPQKIEEQVKLIESEGPNCALVHCEAFGEDSTGALVSTRGSFAPATGACFQAILARRVTAIAPSVLFRRSAYDSTPGFDQRLVGEDLDFYAALTSNGFTLAYDPRELMVKRMDQRSLGGRFNLLWKDPFITLEKYRDRLDDATYQRLQNGYYEGMGRGAAGVGQLGLSALLYWTLAKRTRSLRPLLAWAVRSTRHLGLLMIGSSARSRLKAARAAKVA